MRSSRDQKPHSSMTSIPRVRTFVAISHCTLSTGARSLSSSALSEASSRICAIHSSGDNRSAGRAVSSCLASVVLPAPGNPQIRKRVAIILHQIGKQLRGNCFVARLHYLNRSDDHTQHEFQSRTIVRLPVREYRAHDSVDLCERYRTVHRGSACNAVKGAWDFAGATHSCGEQAAVSRRATHQSIARNG